MSFHRRIAYISQLGVALPLQLRLGSCAVIWRRSGIFTIAEIVHHIADKRRSAPTRPFRWRDRWHCVP